MAKVQIKARFSGAVLFECELGAEWDGRSSRNQRGEAIRKALASGSNLRGSDLSGSNLRGAKITHIITRIWRTIDAYEFIAFATDRGVIIRAGCRTMSLNKFRQHVAEEYPDTDKAEETLAIIDFIESRAALREAAA